jgi:hypothetical protein
VTFLLGLRAKAMAKGPLAATLAAIFYFLIKEL